ncbi:MAG: hypothetical protein KC609_14610 [Myxococcales bacterium]|nr:hypothetical protein [Myxococcales bacterium]
MRVFGLNLAFGLALVFGLVLGGGCRKGSDPTTASTSGPRTDVQWLRPVTALEKGPLAGVDWRSTLDQLRRTRPSLKAPLPALAYEELVGADGLRRIWYSFMPNRGLYKIKLDFRAPLSGLVKRATTGWGAPTRTLGDDPKRKRLVWRIGSSPIEVELAPHLMRKGVVRLLIRDTRIVP